jgi:hypothetical protein
VNPPLTWSVTRPTDWVVEPHPPTAAKTNNRTADRAIPFMALEYSNDQIHLSVTREVG